MILKTPGASAIAIISLAQGIEANTAVFSIIDTLLLKRLPVRSPQELYRVIAGKDRASWNYADYVAFRDHNASITLAACAGGSRPVGMQLADGDPAAPPEIAHAAVVSGNYFTVLGIEPRVGRVLNPEDDRVLSASPHVVLSHDYRQARFGSDPRVLGRKLRLNGYPFTIVGVLRAGFQGLNATASPDLYIPILMFGEISGEAFSRWNNPHSWWLKVFGRIRPGATIPQSETELFSVLRNQEESEKRTARDARFVGEAQPIRLEPGACGYSCMRNRLEKPLLVLMSVIGLVLLIAWANVANLMPARGAARQREMIVRIGLRATRSQVMS